MRNLYNPNRFNVASIQAQQTLGGDVMQMNEEGDYVEWRDYKRALDEIRMLTHTIKYWEIEAKTDNDRWLRALEDVDRLRERYAEAAQENARLKAEVERLRKAGDAMVELLDHMDVVMDMNSDHPEVEAWNAAKKGKPQS